MGSRDFVYWLQGFFEITGAEKGVSLTKKQVALIQRHLNMVFEHEIDPSLGDEAHQGKLRNLHNGMSLEQLEELKKRVEQAEKKAENAVSTAASVRRDPFGPRIMC